MHRENVSINPLQEYADLTIFFVCSCNSQQGGRKAFGLVTFGGYCIY